MSEWIMSTAQQATTKVAKHNPSAAFVGYSRNFASQEVLVRSAQWSRGLGISQAHNGITESMVAVKARTRMLRHALGSMKGTMLEDQEHLQFI